MFVFKRYKIKKKLQTLAKFQYKIQQKQLKNIKLYLKLQ